MITNASVAHSTVVAGNNNTVTFTYEKAQEAVAEIGTKLIEESISTENQETAMEMLADIREKISQQKKPSIIKSVFIGLKDFLIGVGASATVAVVQYWMGNLF